MASTNPFGLLGDNDNDDPSQLAAVAQPGKVATPKKAAPPPQKLAAPAPAAAVPAANLPSKPLPPAQAVREARNEGTGRGFGRGGRGFGRGGRGLSFNRESVNENSFNVTSGGVVGSGEEGDVSKPSGGRGSYGDRPRGPYRGGRRGGFGNGEVGDDERPPRRQFERRSGTGRGYEVKRDGTGRGNWGTATDEIVQDTEELTNANEKVASPEKQPVEEENTGENKENPENESEEKEPEDKEMTLEEYGKVLEEKRKALQALKTEERKVTLDKDLESMKQLSNKKENLDVFIKLGSDKDKRKEGVDKEERAKKAVNINEFLKPTEGESYYNPGGRGRGRGRGYRGGYSGGRMGNNVLAPSITDEGQFPTLGA